MRNAMTTRAPGGAKKEKDGRMHRTVRRIPLNVNTNTDTDTNTNTNTSVVRVRPGGLVGALPAFQSGNEKLCREQNSLQAPFLSKDSGCREE